MRCPCCGKNKWNRLGTLRECFSCGHTEEELEGWFESFEFTKYFFN